MNPKPVNKSQATPMARLEMEIEIRFTKPTDRVRDVMNDKDFEEFKKRMNAKGYE